MSDQSSNTQPTVKLIPRSERMAILQRAEFLDVAYDWIANGGTLITLAKSMGLRFSDISAWKEADPDRAIKIEKAYSARAEYWKEFVREQLSNISAVDIRMIYTDSGRLKDISQWPDSIAQAIIGMDVDEIMGRDDRLTLTKKIKFADKLHALELLGKEMGMFIQRHAVTQVDSLEELVAGSFDDEPKANDTHKADPTTTPQAEVFESRAESGAPLSLPPSNSGELPSPNV